MTDQQARRIEYMRLDQITKATWNAKNHHPDIGRSLDRFGYVEAITWDERTGKLVAGHGRLDQLAAKHAAGDPAPEGVTVLDDGTWAVPVQRGWASADDDEARAYLIASNELTTAGGWNTAELEAGLAEMRDRKVDIGGLGLDIAMMTGTHTVAEHERKDPEPREPADVQQRVSPGQVWALGPHRLVCGDSTDPEVAAAAIDGARLALVWTDPPYGIAYKAMRFTGEPIANDRTPADALRTLVGGLTAAKEAVALFVCCDWRSLPMVVEAFALIAVKPKATIVWDKGHQVQNLDRFGKSYELIVYAGPFGGCPTLGRDVWFHPRDYAPDHPTPKPVSLVLQAIEAASNHGAHLYDPFAGSGSVLIAADQGGRIAHMVELSPGYCDVILDRWERHGGVPPVLATA